MATKTFEELRKLAIQIRDEKANKQNTALRIGNFLLSSLDKMESMDIADIAEAVLQAETAADEAKRQADIVAQSGDIVEEAIKQGAAAEAAAAAANAAADKATNEGLFKTQQDLSEEEQGQVKRNLGIEDLMASLETQTIEGFSETVNATTSTKSVDNIIPPSIDFAIVDLGSTDGRELPTTPSMSVVLAKVTDDGRVKMQGYLKTSHEEYNIQVVSGSAEKYALNVNIITDIETTYKVFQIRYLSSSDGGKFKGSYGQLSQLQTAYPTAGNGSYAFVGNPRHLYEWVTNAWTDRGEFITNVDQAIDAQSERAIANKAVTAKLTELEVKSGNQIGKILEGEYNIEDIILKGREFAGFDIDFTIEQIKSGQGAIQGYDENDNFIESLYFENGNVKAKLPSNFYYLQVKYSSMRVTKEFVFDFNPQVLKNRIDGVDSKISVIDKILWVDSEKVNPYIQEMYLYGTFNGKDIKECGAYIDRCGYDSESDQSFMLIKDENDQSIIDLYMRTNSYGYYKFTQNGVTIELVNKFKDSPFTWTTGKLEKGKGLLKKPCFNASFSPYIYSIGLNINGLSQRIDNVETEISNIEVKTEEISENIDEINKVIFEKKEIPISTTNVSEDGNGRINDDGTQLIEFVFTGDGNITRYYQNTSNKIETIKIYGTSNPYIDVVPLFAYSDETPIIGGSVDGVVKSQTKGGTVNIEFQLKPNQYVVINGYANKTEVAKIVLEPKEIDAEKLNKVYSSVFVTPNPSDISLYSANTKIENDIIVDDGYDSKYYKNETDENIDLIIQGTSNQYIENYPLWGFSNEEPLTGITLQNVRLANGLKENVNEVISVKPNQWIYLNGNENKLTVKKIENEIEKYEHEIQLLRDSNVLWGKKYAACGNSFTAGDFINNEDEEGKVGKASPEFYDPEWKSWKTYAYWIAKKNGMIFYNDGISGSMMHVEYNEEGGVDSPNKHFAYQRYLNVPKDTDYLTLMFGLNEWNIADTPEKLGTRDSTDDKTLWGAWNKVMKHFVTEMPFCKIGIIIADAWMAESLRNAIIEIAKWWGVPYLDLKGDTQIPLQIGGRYDNSDINPEVIKLRNKAFQQSDSDSHPNPRAHLNRYTIIENFLRSL